MRCDLIETFKITISNYDRHFLNISPQIGITQLAGVVEYTDCTSAVG